MSVTVRCRVCQEWRSVGEIARAELPYRCLRCVGEGREFVDEPSELDRLRERAEQLERERDEARAEIADANQRRHDAESVLWHARENHRAAQERAEIAAKAAHDLKRERDALRTALVATADALDAATEALSDALGCDFDDCDDAACPAYLAGLAEIQARAALGEGRP